jgi:hypothetical protein
VDERLDKAEADLPNAIDKGGAVMARDQIAALRRLRASARPAAGAHPI